jgi:signal transduction histidine kinase
LLHASKDLTTLARGDLDAELSWEVVDLGQLARQVTAAYPGVHLEGVPQADASQGAGAADMRVVVDPVRMRQVLRNLVRNAVRAAGRPQGVTVRVRTTEDGAPQAGDGGGLPGETLRLEVEDDGPGLRPEEREAIFGRYVTGSGGTGLGLAVVRRLITLLGGTVSVRSKPGQGATFVVTLPTFAASVEEPESHGETAVP